MLCLHCRLYSDCHFNFLIFATAYCCRRKVVSWAILARNSACIKVGQKIPSKLQTALIISDHPNCNWSRVWLNISTRELLSPQKSALYMWVNQKVPCRRLLFRMRRTDGEHCLHCAAPSETMEHKFFNCSRVQGAWRLLQRRLLEMTGRRRPFVCTELLRPSLEWTSAADKIMIKHL